MKFYTLNGMFLEPDVDYEDGDVLVLDVSTLTSRDRVVRRSDVGVDLVRRLGPEELRRRCRTYSLAVEVDAECPICAQRKIRERVESAERVLEVARTELEAISSSDVREILFGVVAALSPREKQVLWQSILPVDAETSTCSLATLSDLERRARDVVNSASRDLDTARKVLDLATAAE